MGAAKMSAAEMFLHADPMVKTVMILLLLASLASWVIIFEKGVLLRRLGRRIRGFKTAAAGLAESRADGLELTTAGPKCVRVLAAAGLAESRDGAGQETRADFRERLERAMRTELNDLLERAGRRVAFLATVGSTCPFIGLFGTVWGIMDSFAGIAASGETSLAVVAPGIAEALFATAAGLAAAIPAVMAFNRVSGLLRQIAQEAQTAIGLWGNHLARRHFEARDGRLERS